MSKNIARKKILCIVVLISLISVFFTGCGDDEYVQQVKNGTMDMVPNVKVGKAFDQFFKNGKWESFISTDNKRMVEFNGECLLNNKSAQACIQFEILNDTQFQLYTIELNGVPTYKLEAIAIMEKILRESKQ